MYFITQAMELTREDLEFYLKELGIVDKITDSMYKGLLTDDLSESIQLLKPHTLFMMMVTFIQFTIFIKTKTRKM